MKNTNIMDKIAILVLAHKSPRQLERLVRSMDDNRFDFFVHVDKKSKHTFAPLNSNNSKTFNLLSDSERHKTYLNDFSLVDATMSLVKTARCKSDYKYYVLLTGQDYPIKSTEFIYERLISGYPTCYIDSYGAEAAKFHGMTWVDNVGYKRFSQRIRRMLQDIVGSTFYYSSKGKVAKIPAIIYDKATNLICNSPRKRLKTIGFTYSLGSHFWMLPDIAIEHLINVYDNDKKLSDVFRHIAAPEESYFQTALSTMTDAVIPNPYVQIDSKEKEMDNPALRAIKWYENGMHTNGHPAIWNTNDFAFIKSAKALFARKFDEDSEILDLIDNQLR